MMKALTEDDAADTLRFARIIEEEIPSDPDATSIYDLGKLFPTPRVRSGSMLRRLIRSTRQIVDGLRAALAAGWDVGPELAHEQRRLALLEELA